MSDIIINEKDILHIGMLNFNDFLCDNYKSTV